MELSFEDSEYDEVGINVAQVVDDLDDLMNCERSVHLINLFLPWHGC